MKSFVQSLLWLFDLDDGRGNPSFSKGVILTLLAWFVWVMRGAKPSDIGATVLGLIVALIAASMGRSVFLRYLDRKNP